jgi:Ion channel
MLTVATVCGLLVALTTLLHYEVLRGLNAALPSLPVADRAKLLVVMVGAFFAHAAEIAIYGVSLYVLVTYLGAGILSGSAGASLTSCLYFSAETYTSLGFGDLTPVGPVRLLAGTEALNGLLLIGWSASFAYISMEKFWNAHARTSDRSRTTSRRAQR